MAFGCKVCTAQGFVGQSAYRAVRTIDSNRIAICRVFADGDGIGKAEIDFVAAYSRNDIFIFARVGNGFAQIDFVCIAVVCGNGQAFIQLVADFIQSILNGMYSRACRTVSLFDGKARLSDRTVRTDGRVQCGCKRFDLLDICRVGVCRTFGYFGDLVVAVIQTVFSQGDRGVCRTVGDGQSVILQYAIARSYFRCNQSCSRQRAVACFQGSGSYAGHRNIVIQFDGNVVAIGGSGDVAATFNADALSQFFA